MRLCLSFVLLVVCLYTCECRKRTYDKDLGAKNGYEKPTASLFHKGVKYRSGRTGEHQLNIKKKFRGKNDFKPANAATMKFPDKNEVCKTVKCGHKEICLVNPKTQEEKCISKKSLREGRRLFRTFHKKKATLQDDTQIKALEEKLLNAEHMKDVYELMKDFKTHGKFGRFDKKAHSVHYKKYPSHNDAAKAEDKMVDLKAFEQTKLGHVHEATSVDECRPHEFYELRKRLVSWFVMLHTESRQDNHHRAKKLHGMKMHGDFKKKHHLDMSSSLVTEHHGRCACTKSVMWEFRKQDSDADSHLSHKEMTMMESNRREPCMKPFLKSCDFDADSKISMGEWCCCFTDTPAPCEHKKKTAGPNDWMPKCDKEGFYQREQCDVAGWCWCVDLNGNKIDGTKVDGSAHCGKYDPNGHLIKE